MDLNAADMVPAAEVRTLPVGIHMAVTVRFPVEQVDEDEVADIEIPVKGFAVVAEFEPYVSFERNASVSRRRSLDGRNLSVHMRNRLIGHRYLP